MDKSNQTPKKPYSASLGLTSEFFIPHQDANYANAQDVIHFLVSSAKNISIASWNCFEDGERLVIKDKVVADLIFEIQTKLEMIEKLLPMAFEGDGGINDR